ncbi:CinA family protein [Azonexus sp.]|uniref:CinA family protein n=1 Tax=Azonexus sp. TaxID=1872668 RepID=UPI0039E58C44
MENLSRLAERLGQVLMLRNDCVAVAESCTGGALGQAMTEIAGASAWFERGFITYSNAAKTEMLGVAQTLVLQHGAVSEAVAKAMAEGVLAHSPADWSVAITGIAGPSGGSPEKPVGTVCFAWAGRAAGCAAQTRHFSGGRQAVREQATAHALRGLLHLLEGSGNYA